jgi:tetratricopeptide (TPR) repeat protein
VDEDDRALRATLLAQLAFAQYFDRGRDAIGPGGERRCSRSARESLRIARDAGDPSALAAALHAQMYSIAGLDAGAALELSTEMVELGLQQDDWELVLWGRSWRVQHHLMLCDIGAVDVEVRAFTELTEELRVPVYQWFTARWRAVRSLMAGRLEEGERLALQAFEIGQAAQHGEAAALHLGGQLAMARELQGRRLELLAPIEAAVAQYPSLVAWRCALAALYAVYGRPDEAREHVDLLAANDFAAVPRDWDWLVAMRTLTFACCALDDAPRCEVLLEQLRPFADVSACSGWATMCGGPVATLLGMLATVGERWDEAEHHFEAALRLAAGLASPPFIAQAQVAYAWMRLLTGERGRGLELAGRALTAADSMGMVEVAEQAHALLVPRRHTAAGPDG